MIQDHGWISYAGGGDNAHLTEEQRRWVEEQRRESRGGLLGIVEVRVYENRCEAQVSFPRGAILGAESDPRVVSDMVERPEPSSRTGGSRPPIPA